MRKNFEENYFFRKHWEDQIRALGGPDYSSMRVGAGDAGEGAEIIGGSNDLFVLNLLFDFSVKNRKNIVEKFFLVKISETTFCCKKSYRIVENFFLVRISETTFSCKKIRKK